MAGEDLTKRTLAGGWTLDHAGRPSAEGGERKDAARNRRRVLEAASSLFAERGVCETTMEEISSHAGVGKGTLYRRYPNKGLLCQALLDEPTRNFQAEIMYATSDRDLSPLERLELFFERLVRFMEENLDLLYGAHTSLSSAERLSHPAYDWRRWTVLGLLREAARQGEVSEELDLDYLATALLAPLDVELYHHQRRTLRISESRVISGLASLIPRSTAHS